MTDAIKMQLSAFVDGELSSDESELLIRRIGRDPELRALVAQYQSIGRAMRAESEPAGIGELLDRVRADIDESAVKPTPVSPSAATPTWRRPLAGLAVAASVAVVALLGMTQREPTDTITAEETYTVPTAVDQPLFEQHSWSAGDFETQIISLELRGEEIELLPVENVSDEAPEEAADGETAEAEQSGEAAGTEDSTAP